MKSKTLLIVLVILVAGAAFVGYKMWNKPHAKVEDGDAIKLTATELCKAYADGETKANDMYLSEVLAVTGAVSGVSQNQDGYKIITIQGDDPTMEVGCTMRDMEADAEVGTTATIKGFCSGADLFGVKLTDCVIVK